MEHQAAVEAPENRQRRLWLLGGVASVLAGLVAYLYTRPEPAPPEPAKPLGLSERLEQELTRRLDYLRIDPEGLEQFMKYYVKYYEQEKPKDLAEDLVSRFLLSSDFFDNGGDERRRVRFVAFHHPYTTPCYQPLAGG